MAALAGDLNGDNTVNISDFNIFIKNFGMIGENIADINLDGEVNISDFLILAGNFGKSV